MHSVWTDATRIITHHNAHCWTSVDRPLTPIFIECCLEIKKDMAKKDFFFFWLNQLLVQPFVCLCESKIKEMSVPEVGVSEEGVCCKIVFL